MTSCGCEVIKCIGIWGKLFGHKFHTYDLHTTHCTRCGIEKGQTVKCQK